MFWLIAAVIFVGALIFGWSLSRAAAGDMAGNLPPSVLHSCHYCNKDIDLTSNWTHRKCPNCKEEDYYHGGCGTKLFDKHPFCHGVNVGDMTGHIISLKHPLLCAHCGLAKQFWTEHPCSPTASQFLNNRTSFTSKDEKWLKSMRISLKEDQKIFSGL